MTAFVDHRGSIGGRPWTVNRCVGILRSTGLIAVVGFAAVGTPVARATPPVRKVTTPAFIAGPRITQAGSIWLSTRGQTLTTSTGVSRALSSEPVFPVSSPDSRWEAQVSRGHVLTGLLGRRLTRDALLGHCPPLRSASDPTGSSDEMPATPLAISGSRLFAVVDPRCLHRRGYGHAALLVENLKTHSWNLLTSVPAGAVGLAAADRRVAVTLAPTATSSETSPVIVAVYDTRTGRRLFRLSAPIPQQRAISLTTAVDGLGDVLVTVTSHAPAPGFRTSSGWWATPRSPVAHVLPPLLTTEQALPGSNFEHQPPPTGVAALSHARIAYATTGGYEEGQRIDVLDIRHLQTRTAVQFQGDTGVLGVDFADEGLAWVQQSAIPEGGASTTPDGVRTFSCSIRPLGPAQLEIAELDALPSSGLVVGNPLPAADQPPCTAFER
jgi:hypothetical protein